MSQTVQKKWKRPVSMHFRFLYSWKHMYINVLLIVNVDARWQSPGKVIRGGQALILNKGWWLTLSDWHCDQLSSPAPSPLLKSTTEEGGFYEQSIKYKLKLTKEIEI